MKRILLSVFIAFLALCVKAQTVETANEAVKNMGLGWNLGNTFDASGRNVTSDPNNDAYWGQQGLESETYWGQKTTKKELFTMMKNAGFGAIRVPVTWYNHMDPTGKVDAAWMARVHEVVSWVLDAGLYCIVNVHHDTGADSDSHKSWLKADMDTYNAQKDRYEYLWKQIAEEFKDCDERLLFESYNEMLDIKSSWCFASFACPGQYNAQIAASAYEAINSYAQSFVNVVRATGGNNSQRNLIVNTYAAACGGGTWNSHLTDPLSQMNLPQDEVENHIILEVHTYPNITSGNMQKIKAELDQNIDALNTHLVAKGAPVIIGEWGTSNVDADATDYDVRRDVMFQFVEYFVKRMKENNMGLFYWMGLTDGAYRTYPAFNQADLAECMAKAFHGDDFQGEFPEYEQPSSVVVFEGEKVLGWGDGITIDAGVLKTAGSKCELELTYTQTQAGGDDIQLYYGNWSDKAKFIVDGKTYNGDFNPSSVYHSGAGTEHVTTITFPSTDYDKISQLGLIIHGVGITLKKVVVTDPESTDITIPFVSHASSPMYNLAGMRVDTDYKGIVICHGKKYLNN